MGCCGKPKETNEPKQQDSCCGKKEEPKEKKDKCCGSECGTEKK